ncbi:hypothetical protein HQ545_04020 [Candidatus Woesearchaeota archaeon]|nr:hypothetical protein [Candidatus Woesearchaeota archaeon]
MNNTEYSKKIEGSVKSIGVIIEPTIHNIGLADFYVKNDYSVSDWGKMPLPEGVGIDNRALLFEAAYNFELLAKAGLPVCYKGLVTDKGNVMNFDEAVMSGGQIVAMRMDFANVLPVPFVDGRYDYSRYQNPLESNYMVPVEWIFREAGPLADGSSLVKRMKKGECTAADYGLPAEYKAGNPLPFRVSDASTKYEKDDRYLSGRVLREMAGLSEVEWKACEDLHIDAAKIVVEHAASRGIKVYDGKVEMFRIRHSINGRYNNFVLADFVGTKDENRREVLPYGNLNIPVPTSKQAKRNAHKLLNPAWAAAVDEEKNLAEEEGRQDWKERVLATGLKPTALPGWYIEADNNLSNAVVNTICGKKALLAPALDDAALEFLEAKNRLEDMVNM